MSAYIVSKKHIDYLVSACLRNRDRSLGYWFNNEVKRVEFTNADEIGALLWRTNVQSVAYRYPTALTEDLPGPVNNEWMNDYTFRRQDVDTVQALKALDCYEYQSCELPDWTETEAFTICQVLRKRLCQSLPRYEEAAWSIA